MNKDKLRKKILAVRDRISKAKAADNSRKIFEKLAGLKEFANAKKIMFYSSFRNEVETFRMIEKTLKIRKKVYLPNVVGDKMEVSRITSLRNLSEGSFGILEPKVKKKYLSEIFDIVIVPGVVFDKRCNRIGWGKGYFDRFLKDANAVKIGLAHSLQVVDKIDCDKNDVPMDYLITEKKILRR